tara:strand:+ start:311 stop:1084 length:774 start_codon:yes stop_codon:yes gene_type:complete
MAGYRRDLEAMGASLAKIKNPFKRNKANTKDSFRGKEVNSPSNTNLDTFEVNFKPSKTEKVLMEANRAVNNKKVSWRKSKGKFLGVNLGEMKNKAKAKFGDKNFSSTGECTNNTCVTTVADYHKRADIDFSKEVDNRSLKKQLSSGELGYSKTSNPKHGDLVQFSVKKRPKIRGTNITNPFAEKEDYETHIGVVSDINKKGRPTRYIGTSGTADPNLKRGTHYQLKNGKETKIKKPEKKTYYSYNVKSGEVAKSKTH